MAKVLKVRNSDNTDWVEIASAVPEVPDISTYLTISSASSTYATKVELENIDLSSASAAAVTYLVDSAPATLDTLNELAAALNDDANFAGTVTTALSNKLNTSEAYSVFLTQMDASNYYLTPQSASTVYATKVSPSLSGNVSISGSVAVTGIMSVQEILESATISASAAGGVVVQDITAHNPVRYFTQNSTGNWTFLIVGNGSTNTLDQIMPVGRSLTIVFLATNGATAYYPTSFLIDGNSITPKWQGGAAPTFGNINSIDAYTYTIIKTASNTFTVLASQTRFA